MSEAERPFDGGRPRPIVTALDMLRRQIDHEAFDAAVFSLDAVAADLGYGDVRPLPGAVAWIDRLREDDKRIGVAAGVDRVEAALELAGIADRIDVVVTGSSAAGRLGRALEELGVEADRAVVVSVDPGDLEAARAAGVELAIGVARGQASPESLRRAGAATVVADLQELLGSGLG
jgi:beta-phosphoglucomutase-like phosphatase (HAD superfamily)